MVKSEERKRKEAVNSKNWRERKKQASVNNNNTYNNNTYNGQSGGYQYNTHNHFHFPASTPITNKDHLFTSRMYKSVSDNNKKILATMNEAAYDAAVDMLQKEIMLRPKPQLVPHWSTEGFEAK